MKQNYFLRKAFHRLGSCLVKRLNMLKLIKRDILETLIFVWLKYLVFVYHDFMTDFLDHHHVSCQEAINHTVASSALEIPKLYHFQFYLFLPFFVEAGCDGQMGSRSVVKKGWRCDLESGEGWQQRLRCGQRWSWWWGDQGQCCHKWSSWFHHLHSDKEYRVQQLLRTENVQSTNKVF